MLGQLRLVGFIEGISYLVLLFIAMPLKYMADMPMAVKIVGGLHGFLFVAFIVYILLVGTSHKWSMGKMFLAFLASIVPFGTFWADIKLFRQ